MMLGKGRQKPNGNAKMKGIIFTELVRFMEKVQSADFADAVISGAELPNDGAFTSVGNYPSEYALKMVGQASEQSGIEASASRIIAQLWTRHSHLPRSKTGCFFRECRENTVI